MKNFYFFTLIFVVLSSKIPESSIDIIPPKLKTSILDLGPVELKIQYCKSCGFINTLNSFSDYFKENLPNIKVIPEDYPLKNLRKFLYYLAIATEVIATIFLCLIDYISPYLDKKFPTQFIDYCKQKRLFKIAFVLLFGNMINGYIKSTGAFEVFCDNKLIWSTIEKNGQFPTVTEITNLILKTRNKV